MFKQIEHYPNYEVSSTGIVRNKTTGRCLSWVNNGTGYMVVKLYNQHKPKGRLCLVHRLVLSTFHPNNENKDVNHKDGNKRNNSVDNLEWVTKSENTRHAHKTGLFKDKLTIDDVKAIKSLLQFGAMSYSEIGKKYSVGHATIWKIAKGILYDYV